MLWALIFVARLCQYNRMELSRLIIYIGHLPRSQSRDSYFQRDARVGYFEPVRYDFIIIQDALIQDFSLNRV